MKKENEATLPACSTQLWVQEFKCVKQRKWSKLKFYGNRGNFGEKKSIIILITENLLLEMGSSSHNRLRCFPLPCVTLPVISQTCWNGRCHSQAHFDVSIKCIPKIWVLFHNIQKVYQERRWLHQLEISKTRGCYANHQNIHLLPFPSCKWDINEKILAFSLQAESSEHMNPALDTHSYPASPI